MRIRSRTAGILCTALALLIMTAGLFAADYYSLLPRKTYTADDFGIKTLKSETDFNGNGADDYTDIMLGARADAENHPEYDSAYQPDGYPPDSIGVCTDVVWRAFKNAGYSLRDMIDHDIQLRPQAYTRIEKPDSRIDFRRVYNLHVFFDEYAESLTADPDDIASWQPGEIVIFRNDKHIGFVSDKRSRSGRPYIIHNGGQPKREEDYLKRDTVTAHYRFNAARIPESVLKEWRE